MPIKLILKQENIAHKVCFLRKPWKDTAGNYISEIPLRSLAIVLCYLSILLDLLRGLALRHNGILFPRNNILSPSRLLRGDVDILSERS